MKCSWEFVELTCRFHNQFDNQSVCV
uniref:Uncharacterized protein n=1 Tax=Rhizophora mucronata TaxID=61149 RepID=A0A2P2QE68_RHIMU